VRSLREFQKRFAAALADPALAPPAGSVRRFGVHRNNARAGLLWVLEARFPAVKRLVGDEFFRAMTEAYIANDPPTSPILMLYGAGFASFIAGFAPAADLPYLADVARLEWLQHEATNAADANPIGAAELAAVPPADVPGLRLRLHPSLRLFASNYPALTIWELNASPGEVEPQKLAHAPEWALLLRPALTVEIRRIPEAFHAFVVGLLAGEPLAIAVEAAASTVDHFDVQQCLAILISIGAVAGYDLCTDSA